MEAIMTWGKKPKVLDLGLVRIGANGNVTCILPEEGECKGRGRGIMIKYLERRKECLINKQSGLIGENDCVCTG